jgi:endoglucanase
VFCRVPERSPIFSISTTSNGLLDDGERSMPARQVSQAYTRRCLSQNLMCFFVGGLMQPAYAKLFKGLSEGQLDHILMSFSREQCTPNEGLTNILKKHMACPA